MPVVRPRALCLEGARGGNAAFRDAYVIAANFLVSPGGPNQNNPGASNGGLRRS